jgi:hypothetical protein
LKPCARTELEEIERLLGSSRDLQEERQYRRRALGLIGLDRPLADELGDPIASLVHDFAELLGIVVFGLPSKHEVLDRREKPVRDVLVKLVRQQGRDDGVLPTHSDERGALRRELARHVLEDVAQA